MFSNHHFNFHVQDPEILSANLFYKVLRLWDICSRMSGSCLRLKRSKRPFLTDACRRPSAFDQIPAPVSMGLCPHSEPFPHPGGGGMRS
ncbi:hypothetical protein B2D07_10020 [Desulfococcus multivorans]|nr:uncharacterized protein Dmul_20180 [Desulfococcus multivorans]AQV01074.1 hypothetical protein B2D07_10020 [Desulfococcus multivorans]